MPKKSKSVLCPECKSPRIWKDGIRHTRNGEVQRYICRSCGFRFSDPTTKLKVKLDIPSKPVKLLNPAVDLADVMVCHTELPVKKPLNIPAFLRSEDIASHNTSNVCNIEKRLNPSNIYSRDCQVCAQKEAKNLVKVKSRTEKRAAGATEPAPEEVRGKIVEYAWWMKKQGYAETTITVYTNAVEVLAKRGANIFDPESVKETIAKQEWGQARKNIAVNAYTLFLLTLGMEWHPPIYRKPPRKLPFIPMESEIDQLMAASGKKTTVFLQLLKETAMRSGEANRLRWVEVDAVRRTIALNNPEKNGTPRMFKVSNKLIDMLESLPKKSEFVFGGSVSWYKATFYKSRKRIARKLQNPRILSIHLHTFRHWKATMLYHQTKDILYVKQFLGHKRIEDTLLYVQIADAIFKETTDEFTVRVATKPEEIKALLEVGFEYVCEKDGLMFFRKRK